MSTLGSIFYHDNETTGVNIHVYEELSSEVHQDIRLEIEFEHGTINIPWPKDLPVEEVVKLSIKSYER